jgi:hypothetical protein
VDLGRLGEATREHQEILRAVAVAAHGRAIRLWNSRLVDLVATGAGGALLFEAKSTTIENAREQVRTAVGQLLEYRYRYRRRLGLPVGLALVTRRLSDETFFRAFLADIGIACFDVSRPEGLAALRDRFVALEAPGLRASRLSAIH